MVWALLFCAGESSASMRSVEHSTPDAYQGKSKITQCSRLGVTLLLLASRRNASSQVKNGLSV